LAGCAGGGGGRLAPTTAPAPSSAPTTTPNAAASVRFTFTIPKQTASVKRSAGTRKPNYVSGASSVATVVALGSSTVTTSNISLTAPGVCTFQISGDKFCSISAGAPLGDVTFEITIADGNGNVLSQGTTSQVAIVEGVNTVAQPIILNAVVASVALNTINYYTGPQFISGNANAASLDLNFLDADNNVIPAGSPISGAIDLVASDPSITFGTSLPLTTVPSSVAITYTGAALLASASGVTITASSSPGITNGNFLEQSVTADLSDGINSPVPTGFTATGNGVNLFNGIAGQAPLGMGEQGVVLQLGGGGLSQTVTGLTSGATYTFSYQAESWQNGSAVQFEVNGESVGDAEPAPQGSYTTYTPTFTAPASGIVTLSLVNTGSNDLSVTNLQLIGTPTSTFIVGVSSGI